MAVSRASDEGGRARQRRRTRRAIVAAAMELMSAGETPTVAQVAEAADVSKRTVYLYFPTREQLLITAAVGMMSDADVEAVLEGSPDPEERAAAIVRALTEVSPEIERAGRELIRLTVAPEAGDEDPPRRGQRRIEWIEQALEPARASLGKAAYERLVTAIAMICGFEAVVVQRDLRGLSPKQGADASEWAARALVRAALAEARR